MEKSSSNQILSIVNEASLPDVSRDDRVYIRQILHILLTFDETMPVLEWSIQAKATHYNLNVRGWNRPLLVKKWYLTFEGPQRDRACDHIIETSMTPSPDSGIGPLCTIRINRLTFTDGGSTHTPKKKTLITKKKRHHKSKHRKSRR